MNRTTLRVLGVLAFAFLVGLLAAGCQDDGPSLTGASSVIESASQLSTTSPSQSNSGEGSGEDGEDGDDDSEDDTSDDDSDDASEDDESDDDADDDSDDESADDESADDDGDSDVRGLVFGTEACPVLNCVLALRIKDTLVVVTDETEIVNEPAGETPLTAAELAALASAHPGLPMRAEGSSEGGVLVAQRLRIDDEIRATGQVTAPPGCGFGLAVQFLELCFDLSPGLTAPVVGSTVRVEGSVPSDFTLPFVATRIEPAED